jgi:hypothetical protein
LPENTEPQSSEFTADTQRHLKHSMLNEESEMEEFPIWFKLVIYATIGLTALYAVWGVIQSILQA